MNYCERIQKAIDFLEENLENEIRAEDAAKEAFMSVSNFYGLFFAITGYQVKEYLINRRISLAAEDIRTNHMKVLDAAVKYAYSSPDAFSRIFRKVTGCSPGTYSGSKINYKFERIMLMDKYFEIPDEEMNEKYPDIKVLKEIQPMRAAYYCYYGRDPEVGAFTVMKEWVMREKLDIRSGNYRIFGYNAPDCDPTAEEYGYEVCVTIPEDMAVEDEKVKTKRLDGGLYAVIAIERTKDEELEVEETEELKREEFPGGLYLKKEVKYKQNARSWFDFIRQMEENENYGFGPQPFMEQYLLNTFKIGRETDVVQYMPVVRSESV